jgi:putative peptidoglycan lipid II flippase
VAGLTVSAGIAGWVEFLLLRRAMGARIGRTCMPRARLVTLWVAALAAGLVGFALARLDLGHGHLLSGSLAMLAFAAVYGALTLALGVPEARALVSRVRRR